MGSESAEEPPDDDSPPKILTRFDTDLLDELEPFEIDTQLAHLYAHHPLGVSEIKEVWEGEPFFYPADPPAHWLMVGWFEGAVLVVPLAPSNSGDPSKCRPIGCYTASKWLADLYLDEINER